MATAIRNPATGKLIVGKKKNIYIKDKTLKYCMETLASNTIEKEFEIEMNQKKYMVICTYFRRKQF